VLEPETVRTVVTTACVLLETGGLVIVDVSFFEDLGVVEGADDAAADGEDSGVVNGDVDTDDETAALVGALVETGVGDDGEIEDE